MICKTYTFHEYSNYRKNKKYNKKLEKFLMCFFIVLLNSTDVFAGVSASRINSKGAEILKLASVFAKWVILIMGTWECGKAIAAGNTKGVPQIAIKYLLAYASLKFLPWGIDEIDALFN